MKTTVIFILISIFCMLSGCSGGISEKDIPRQVLTSFNGRFTDVSKVRWSSESDSTYEASFVFKEKKRRALFGKSGQWIETETSIITAELPLTVVQTLNNGFYHYRIKSCEQMETPSQGVYYEVVVKNAMETLQVQLNAEGIILGKEAVGKD